MDYSPHYEYIDKKDIRNSFRLPSFDELNNRMRERREDQSWPPKFPSHENYDPAFPMWAGFTKEPMTKLTLTDELDSDNSSEASGNSSGSGRSKTTRGPRIHHIPILVEARDDSSGYSSDTQSSDVNKTSRQTKSRSTESSGTSQAKYHSGGTNHSTHQAQRSHSNQEFRKEPSQMPPRKSWSQPPSSPPANKVELGVPVTVSHKTQQPVPQQQQQQGGFVTRVAVNQSPTANNNNNLGVPPGGGKPKKEKPDPRTQIKAILDDKEKLKKDVSCFNGTTKDKQYRYLDEMLTRLMLKLDDVDTEGQDGIRQERKNAVKEIQNCISLLEQKIVQNVENAKSREQSNGYQGHEQNQEKGTSDAEQKDM